MINKYDFTLSTPDIFKVFSAKDLIFLYWICPQVDKHLKLFNHYNEIVFTLTGKKTFHHNGNSWPLTDDTALFIKKTAYTTEKHEMVGWEVLAFFFQDAFLRQVYNEYREYLPLKNLPSPPKDMFVPIKVNDTIHAFCYSIVPYFKQKVPPSESLLELKFKEIIFVILSEPENAGLLSYVHSIVDQQKTPIWEVMEANYMFNLTIDEYARIAGRSAAAFKREFNEHYGTSPGKWLTNRRLERTKLLLATSRKTIGEIIYDCGFENISHFSRIFKENYGFSPLQFRQNNPVISMAQ
jgi:AraC family transcriptional regulator, exoenzyme S synthesis regulatory protein ExsA